AHALQTEPALFRDALQRSLRSSLKHSPGVAVGICKRLSKPLHERCAYLMKELETRPGPLDLVEPPSIACTNPQNHLPVLHLLWKAPSYPVRFFIAATCFADAAGARRGRLFRGGRASAGGCAFSASATSCAVRLSTQSATYSNNPAESVRAVSNTTKASLHGELWSFVLMMRYRGPDSMTRSFPGKSA